MMEIRPHGAGLEASKTYETKIAQRSHNAYMMLRVSSTAAAQCTLKMRGETTHKGLILTTTQVLVLHDVTRMQVNESESDAFPNGIRGDGSVSSRFRDRFRLARSKQAGQDASSRMSKSDESTWTPHAMELDAGKESAWVPFLLRWCSC